MIHDNSLQKTHDFSLQGKVDFDFSKVENILTDAGIHSVEVEEIAEAMANDEDVKRMSLALLRVMEMMLPNKLCKTSCSSIGLRCISLLWMVDSGRFNLGSRSLSNIASALGTTRAALSHHVRELEKITGIHSRRQKPSQSVETYRESASKTWNGRDRGCKESFNLPK
jgi:hypothetical protein